MPKLTIAGTEKEVDIPIELSFAVLGSRIRVNAQRGVGNKWAILDIKEDGSVYLHTTVGHDLGFDLDNNLRVKLATSY